MAWRYYAAAWSARGISPSCKLVLVRLADAANDDGYCWPSHRLIQEDTGLSRATVYRVVDSLEKSGWLQRQARSRQNGSQTSSLYRLALADHHGGARPDWPTPEMPLVGGLMVRLSPGETPRTTSCTLAAPSTSSPEPRIVAGGNPTLGKTRAQAPARSSTTEIVVRAGSDLEKAFLRFTRASGQAVEDSIGWTTATGLGKRLKAAIADKGETWWAEVFKRAAASPFLTGQKGGFRADLGWLLKWDGKSYANAEKVLTGKYDPPKGKGPVDESWMEKADYSKGLPKAAVKGREADFDPNDDYRK